MSQELQIKILEDFLHYFLPDGLLDYFEPVMAENHTYKNPQTKKEVPALHLFFDERDNRTAETKDYNPKRRRSLTTFPSETRNLFFTYVAADGSRQKARASCWTYTLHL